jgi:MFS family permease
MAEAMASLLKTYSGAWSDRWTQRRPLILTGYFLSAISKPMIGICGNWTQVLSARLLDRTGKGLRSAPRDALIADSIDEKQRGHGRVSHHLLRMSGSVW